MFPVTINFTLFTLADFSPFGYATNLSESLSHIPYELNRTTNTKLGGTGVSSIAAGGSPGSIEIVVPHHVKPADYVLLSNLAALGSRVTVTVTGYDSATKTIEGTAPSVPTYTTWTVTPLLTQKVPVPVSYGGTGGTARTLLREAGMDYPHGSSQLIFEDFNCSFNQDAPYPWGLRRIANGTAVATAETVAGFNTTYPENYCGLLKLTVTGTQAGDEGTDRVGADAGLLLTYGSGAFLNMGAGGNIDFRVRVLFSQQFSSTLKYAFRAGLKGYNAANAPDFLNFFSLGFEIDSQEDTGNVVVVQANKREMLRQPTNLYLANNQFYIFQLKVNKFEKKAYWYVDGTLVYESSIAIWPNTIDTLCAPALSVENKLIDPAYCYVDYFYASQKIAR